MHLLFLKLNLKANPFSLTFQPEMWNSKSILVKPKTELPKNHCFLFRPDLAWQAIVWTLPLEDLQGIFWRRRKMISFFKITYDFTNFILFFQEWKTRHLRDDHVDWFTRKWKNHLGRKTCSRQSRKTLQYHWNFSSSWTYEGMLYEIFCLHLLFIQNWWYIMSFQVNGEPRKQHLTNWDSLIGRLTKCAQDMIRLGSQRRRNIIIDQVGLFWSDSKKHFVILFQSLELLYEFRFW